MRNIPFAFINEETIAQINHAAVKHQESVSAFAHLAETQKAMRGFISLGNVKHRLVAMLEKVMQMSGPNSIANLERALGQNTSVRRAE